MMVRFAEQYAAKQIEVFIEDVMQTIEDGADFHDADALRDVLQEVKRGRAE